MRRYNIYKRNIHQASMKNTEEVASILRRKLAKRQITQEEFNIKYSALYKKNK